MSITAAMVKELRERTGAPMMECKKFLVATDGDMENAILELRKSGQTKADKKADRVASEGIIVFAKSDDGRRAVLVEINSETDFVARDSNFIDFATQVATAALACTSTDVDALLAMQLVGGTVDEARRALIAKIGENIKIRRIALIDSDSEGALGGYLHGSRIGVLVSMKAGDTALAKDLAMHIAASKPLVVGPEQVPAEEIQREREIFVAQARESGKPDAIIEKMVDGRIKKFLAEVSLLGQSFVKNPSQTVAELLKEKNAEVLSFTRIEVGEGIEKKEDDFVAEVMSQVRES
ncbi:MAG: translation elongation factor Ts [Gammaproteobacteria bacterium]|nr:translation elongation factor Ts [Gammaproteobacteria bacterium]